MTLDLAVLAVAGLGLALLAVAMFRQFCDAVGAAFRSSVAAARRHRHHPPGVAGPA